MKMMCLQFIAHEEGRIRFKPATGKTPRALQYDYMLKDHLGNVRMLLTKEQTDAYIAATMEPATINTEQLYYGNLTNTQFAKPSRFNDPVYSNQYQSSKSKKMLRVYKEKAEYMLLKSNGRWRVIISGWRVAGAVLGAATNSPANVLNDLLSLVSTRAAGLMVVRQTGSAELQGGAAGCTTAEQFCGYTDNKRDKAKGLYQLGITGWTV